MYYTNRPIHPVLRFIYFILRLLAWLGTSVYYRRRTRIGVENARIDGPAIVISNHPSTLMDVLNVCLPIRQELFFLANYGLFKHPVSNWILSRVFCIPIKRKEDVAEGEARDNDAAFEACFVHLNRLGLLYIAPEGVSWMHRWVRPFKSGTARIAFGAERRKNWELDLKILPIGVSYDKPNHFRSEVAVHYGQPLSIKDWKDRATADEDAAIDALTLELENRVRALSIDVRDEMGEKALDMAEQMLHTEGIQPGEDFFRASKERAAAINADEGYKTALVAYSDALASARVTDWGLIAVQKDITKIWASLVLGLPFFTAGYLFWFLPCWLPAALARKLKLYVGYDSNIKTLAGLLTFGLAFWATNKVLANYGVAWHWRMVALGSAAALGYFAEWYMDRWRGLRQVQVARRLAAADKGAFERLLGLRPKG
jgi:glycerol-3-phosphate O-acyltransferase / dihydroxyacetone phosphate acyltransferase